VIFGLLEKMMWYTFIINMHAKFIWKATSIVVLAATITYVCFLIIVFWGIFRYCFSFQQYTQRRRFLFCCHFMGGCFVGSMFTSVICCLLFFPITTAPVLLLYSSDLMQCTAYLVFLKIMIHITNWTHHGCDGWKEEDETLNKKDKVKISTV
jgi:hypothetical protein